MAQNLHISESHVSDGLSPASEREVPHVGLQVIHSCRPCLQRRMSSYFLSLLLCLASSCATPGKPYLVAPAVAGVIHGDEVPNGDVQLRLTVMHRESPTLFDRKEVGLYPDGEFYFDQAQLMIAGHEYSKNYRVYLVLRNGEQDRVIWRTVLSRPAVAGLIQLDCDLDRPIQQGQPCWVDNPLQHPWLVAEGERTFRRLCAGCHGEGGDGDVSTVEDLTQMPPDLRRIAARHDGRFDRADIAEWIEGRSLPMAHGTRVMPVWGERLSQEFEHYSEGDELIGATLDPVLAYLESIQKPD
jgi:mono/diheme cytochrome c family protein